VADGRMPSMEKERKTSHKMFFAWNYDKEEAMLNEKSKNGWSLVKGGCFHSVFEKDDSKRYCYRIDFNMNLLNNSEEKKRYIEMNEDLGWEFINVTFNGWIYLRKEYREDVSNENYDIYTDTESFNAMMDRWIHFSYGLILLEAVLFVVYTYLLIQSKEWLYAIDLAVFVMAGFFIYQGMLKMKEKKK